MTKNNQVKAHGLSTKSKQIFTLYLAFSSIFGFLSRYPH